MPRLRTARVGVLNIKIHPHSPEKYEDLFKTTYSQGQLGKIRGDDWGMIGSLYSDPHIPKQQMLSGTIYKFLNIDPKNPWLDLENRKPINLEKDKGITVPENLKPNLKEIPYIFLLNRHRLFFDTEFISPQAMRKLMRTVFLSKNIQDKYGEVDVIVESTYEAIERILSLSKLTKLHILITLPNDDDLGQIEDKLFERLKNQNIRRLDQTVSTPDEEGIKADKETKALMNIARSNGLVEAKGYEYDKKVELSTVSHPLIESIRYNPETEPMKYVLLSIAEKILKHIVSK